MFACTPNPELRRRLLVVIVAGLVLTGCLLCIYLLLSASSHQSDRFASASSQRPAGEFATSPGSTPSSATPRLGGIADPEAFAVVVAHALFDWDTTAPTPYTEYAGRLVAVADPTGSESGALIADVASYLPTDDAWAYLKKYYTRQWIEIEAIKVPDLWPQALSEAGSQGFAPGTMAYTVEGLRHRSGVWEDEDVSSVHKVAFTVFIVCRPTYPTCHLLRLSRLDEPLE